MNYETIEDIFNSTLSLHAPLKQKCIRANNSLLMTKLLRQNISHRTNLRNFFLETPRRGNRSAYKSQGNKYVKLLRNEKRRYYNNLKAIEHFGELSNLLFPKNLQSSFS